jgi:hypothetical protein
MGCEPHFPVWGIDRAGRSSYSSIMAVRELRDSDLDSDGGFDEN